MKKIVIISISIIMLLVVGICGYIYIDKKYKNNSDDSMVANDNTNKENIIKKNEVIDKENNKKDNALNVKIDNALNVKIDNVNSWNDGTQNFEQYTVNIINKSSTPATNWSIKLSVSDIEISQIWNSEYVIENDVLKLTPVSYNNEIQPNQKIELGFIVKTNNKLNLENFTVEVDGKKVNNSEENKKSKISNSEALENINKNILIRIIREGVFNIMKNTKNETLEENTPTKSTNINETNKNNIENKTPVEQHGKLSVNGTKIVDDNGNIVQLRGVSTHSISAFSEYINKDTFKEMRDSWQISVIRIAMYSNPNDGYTPELHKKVKEAVNYASELGLYVIIDWHILQDNNPNMHKNEAISFFEEMATEFKDNNNVLYEICNEPNGNVTWKKDIKPYAEEVIGKIRAIDTDSIIIVGTPTWSQDVDIVSNDPINGHKNIMYTLHFYSATHKDDLRNKLKTALEKGLPIFVTEFGISDASGNGSVNESEGDKWIELLNENDISWVCWNLSNKNETSAILRNTCNKIHEFEESDFSEEGLWLLKKLKE